jgi:hypothetical protein
MDLQELSDRMEIQAALTRYATAVDSKDWALWRTVFTPDADVDYTSSTPLRGLLPGMSTRSVFGGYYHHEFARTGDGWRSRHLVEQMLWRDNHPADLAR